MRLFLAILTAKILIFMGKLLGRKGTSLPGAAALKICPDLLRILSSRLEKIVVVCGTNGKTTTNNLIHAALEKNGAVACNRLGANMLSGVACALADSAWSKPKFAALEVDEFSARLVFSQIQPDFLVITNLFPDQLDRYGDIENVANALKEAISLAPNCELVLNENDDLLKSLTTDLPNKKHYFTADNAVFTLPGAYNANNIAAAEQICLLLGIPADFSGYKTQIGRMEEFTIDGRPFIFNLAKNPAGFNSTLQTVIQDPREKCVIIAINDGAGDGLDISWLWDVDFECLPCETMCFSCGTRRDDLAVRLKYAEILNISKTTMPLALADARQFACPVTYVLVNYTALFSTHELLRRAK